MPFSFSYLVEKIGAKVKLDKGGLVMRFSDDVDVTEAQRTINFETLVSRIGGSIGVGKELLWITFTCITALKSVASFVRRFI